MTNMMNNIPGGESVPVGVAAWLACLVFIMGAVVMGIKLVKAFRGRPEAMEVQAEAARSYVTKDQCEKGHDSINATMRDLFSKVGGVERGAAAALGIEVRSLRQDRKEDAAALQVRLSHFEEQIGGLVVATNLQNGQLNRIDMKIDNIMRRQETE